MDKLLGMRIFVQIAESGSLTGAANRLDRSLPSVVRALAALEKDLQVRLFNRSTRKIALTEEGQIYLQRCRKILTDIQETEILLKHEQRDPSGSITLTAPVRFGEMHVNPLVVRFLQKFPNIQVNLILLDRVVSMLDEGIDLAIRIAEIGDSSVIIKPVGEIRPVVCATPEILQKYGRPQRPEDLSAQPCIQFTGISAGAVWSFKKQNKKISIKVDGPYRGNQVGAAVAACVNGLGFGQFLCYQVNGEVASGRLEIVLQEFELPPIPVNIVFHHTRLMAARIRLFVDYLSCELKSALQK